MAKLPYTEEELKGYLDADRFKKAEVAAREYENTLGRMEKAGGQWAEKANYMRKTMGNFTVTSEAGADKFLALKAASDQGALGFESMTSAIGKAVLKVGLWMIATTAVIGSIKKIQETVQIWRDLELSLERIGITTRTMGQGLYTYFEEAADVAIRMGMPIQQIMTGMNLALRATASLEDQTLRTTTAQLMLRDAAILGNLAGMQFDQAINVLVGSLRQTGMELHEGIFLLDKWVAVSRSAQVSINDLAQGFSVMAAAAESAGVSVDQINGLIAALSEAVTLGPVEIGNAIRALMSTLYNPESVKLLQNFGIAARDVTGEFRSFWDIMSELSALRMTGALSESQLLEISKAAGAGQRRYAQFQAILKNWETAVKVSTVSANAQNEALTANERIVNTLTNAWDQMSAAQNKFLYALGQNSGAIEDLTKLMHTLARTFDKWSDMDESIARLIKLVAQLTASFVGLKVALLVLTKIGLIKWLGSAYLGAKVLLPALAGIGSVVAMRPAMAMGWSHQAKQDEKGRWHDPAGKFVKAPTSTVTTTMVPTPIVGGALAKHSWAGLSANIKEHANSFGKALVRPMSGVGTMFGVVAGGMIMQQLYKSNWAGIGGSIGAIAGAKFGIVGMAAGSLIGGAIGKIIQDASMTSAQIMTEEFQAFLNRIPVELSSAIRVLAEDIDISGTVIIPLKELIGEQDNVWKENLEKENQLLEKRMRRWDEFWGVPYQPGEEGGRHGTYEQRMDTHWFHRPLWSKLEDQILQSREQIALFEVAMRKSNQEVADTETLYDLQGKAMLKFMEQYSLREDAEKRINEIISDSVYLTDSLVEQQIRLAGAAPLAHAKIGVQLEQFAPHLLEKFVADFPSFDDFFALDPRAYAPLQDLLGTLTTLTQAQKDYNVEIEAARGVLQDLGISWSDVASENVEAIAEQKKYWSSVLEARMKFGTSLVPYYDMWNLDAFAPGERADIALRKLQNIVATLVSGEGALINWEKALSGVEANSALIEQNFKLLSTYIPEGRLEFLSPDASAPQIQALLDRYAELFKGYIRSEPETYHAFVRDEFGVVQRLLTTFEAQPEVWSAMLSELKGIEKNTKVGLEGEWNIPSWYQTPTRYWAIKTTGMQEGFGPAQEGMWELWKEFLSRYLTGTELDVSTENAEQAIDVLCDNIENAARTASEYIEGFDWSPWEFMAEAAKEAEFADTADPSLTITEKINNAIESVWKSFTGAVVKFFNLDDYLDDKELKIPSFKDIAESIFTEAYGVIAKGIHWLLGGEDIEASVQDVGNSFDRLSIEINSTSTAVDSAGSTMSLSLRTTAGQLRTTTSELYNFANAVNYLSGYLDSDAPKVYGGGGHELIPMRQGGVVPATGPYYLHKQEVVSSVSDIKNTNAILNGSYKVLLLSQSYLSSINLGISGLRQEISLLRQQIGQGKSESGGFTEFRRVTNTGYVGVNSLGTRRT